MATVVSLEGKRKTPSLEPLLSLCADDMTQVDREILARMRSPVALIPELASHLVGAGGKRMRPLLTVAAARLCGYVATDDRHIKLVSQRDISTPEATYLEVIKAKTAKLFAAAAEVGAMVAGRNGPERVALQSFGMNLGIAFQLVDDALDYAGREAQLGKTVGDDFREGKITLPVILAFLRGGAIDREFWKRTIQDLDQHE